MQIEQTPPNRPNFGLIVGLFAVCILLIILAGIMFIHWDGSHLRFGRGSRVVRSQLILPRQAAIEIG